MSVQLDIAVSILGQFVGVNDLSSPGASFNMRNVWGFSPGTGAGQASKVFADRRSINASSNDDLDLSGSLVDPLGGPCVFTGVKAIFVKAAAENVNDVVIGGHDTAGFLGPFADASDKVTLKPGEVFLMTNRTANGWPVTAATADILRLANGGAGSTVSYDIVLIGE